MAAEPPPPPPQRLMKLLCSHGGRLVPRGSGGALRYAGGETRVLVVPRGACFRDLAARLSEMAGGAEVRGVRHRLADEGLDDVLVSVTCDEELAHMRDEYDRLRATRPAESFRVFVVSAAPSAGNGGRASAPPPGAGDAARADRSRPPAPPPRGSSPGAARPERAGSRRAPPPAAVLLPSSMRAVRLLRPPPRHSGARAAAAAAAADAATALQIGVRPGGQEAPPAVAAAAKATGPVHCRDAATQKARSRDAEAAMEQRRAIWEFE
ncbi:hypothetical protein ACP4OV_007781 [Aristida adscensionis]